jgi:hypothetical protein
MEVLTGQVTAAIGDWLLNHIKGDDFRMAACVKSEGGEWDKYFTWSSRRIVKDYQNARTNEEKVKQKEWLHKSYKT